MQIIISSIIFFLTLYGCSSHPKINEVNSNQHDENHNQIVEPSFYQEKFLNGVKFFAKGNEPFWSLEIYQDNKIVFEEINQQKITSSNFRETAGDSVDEIIFSAEMQNAQLIIHILKDYCQDNMSGEIFDYKVNVKLKHSNDSDYYEFNGCGKYLYDYRLNDIWVMEEMTGVELKKENLMKGLPIFEFNLNEMKVSGHAGCNQFFGNIIIKGNFISFGTLVSTKMACPDMTVEQKVFQTLNDNNFTYRIEKLKLILESEKGMKMIFRKTD